MPIIEQEKQQARKRNRWPVWIALALAGLLLIAPLVPFFQHVEISRGKTYWTIVAMRDPIGFSNHEGFQYVSAKGSLDSTYTDLWLFRVGDWEYRVFRSERSR